MRADLLHGAEELFMGFESKTGSDDAVKWQCAVFKVGVESRLSGMPLFFAADDHVNSASSEIFALVEDVARRSTDDQGAKVGKAKDFVQAQNSKVGGDIVYVEG